MRERKKNFMMKFSAFVLAFAMVATALPLSGLVANAADATDTVSVLRAYNPNNGEHLMTIDQVEYEANVQRGYDGEGTAWKAPTTSNTPIYRIYNPNSGEHLLVGEGETNVPGWQNEGLKMYSDDEQGVPVYRVFNPNATDAGSHHYTANKDEAAGLVARGWNWDNGGNPVFYGVKDGEVVESAKLVDESGLQSDGTALINDTIRVTYTEDLGNPYQVTWYKDGTAIETEVGSTLDFVCSNTSKAGNYFAVITNTSGKTFKSDTLTVSANEALATLSNYALSQDYAYGVTDDTGATKIDYTSTTDKLVATFTINKNYTGVVGVADTAGNDAGPRTLIGSTNNYQPITDASKFTDETAMEYYAESNKNGIYFVNNDGSYTYKWVVGALNTYSSAGEKTGTLTRGTSYVLGFYQKAISDVDDVKTWAWTSAPSTAPYLTAPAAIVVGQQTTDYGTMTGMVFVDATGSIMNWMAGDKTKLASAPTYLSTLGVDEATLYGNSSKSKTGATSIATEGALMGYKGTYGAIESSYDYYYATVTTNEGVYGADAITLESSVSKAAESIAKKVVWEEDDDKATSAVLDFTTLQGSAKAYIRSTNNTGGQQTVDPTTDSGAFDPTKSGTYRGVVSVSEGDDTATIENAFVATDIGTNNTSGADSVFEVIIIPDDASSYLQIKDSNSSTTGYSTSLSEVPTSVKALAASKWSLTSDGASIVVTGLHAYNQFGKDMVYATSAAQSADVTPIDSTATNREKGTASFTAAAGGDVTLTIVPTTTQTAVFAVDKNDGYSISILGSTLKITDVTGSTSTWYDDMKVVFDGSTILSAKTPSYTAAWTYVGTAAGSVSTTSTASATYGNTAVTLTANKALDQNSTLYTTAGNETVDVCTDAACTTATAVDITITNTSGTLTGALDATTLDAGTYYFKSHNCVYTLTVNALTLTAGTTDAAATLKATGTLATAATIAANDTIVFTVNGVAITASDISSVVVTDTSAGAAIAGNVATNTWTATGNADAAAADGTPDTVVITLGGNYSGTLTFYVTSATTTGGVALPIVSA